MEFESPDVERDFPGLYASESGKRSDASDFSDDSHEKISKKDLLIGKRKDKKDSKKDRGYATLEGESSPEEETDIKSPSKSKKSKTFKFASKKEKREKSREKDNKENDKDKKKLDEKEKKKDIKVKLKLKDKKKCKHDENDIDLPVFGVPLSTAVERSKCHDGIDLPLVVRQCIDHVQHAGLLAENVYKVSGIKSRVQFVKRLYNQREPVTLGDYDLPIATSLLKLFLRELPEPVFTNELLSKFEEAGCLQDVKLRGAALKELVDQLPSCNRTLLAWIVKHFDSIAANEKYNKMNAQSISTVLSPVLQSSHRLISALLCHSSDVFQNIILSRYVPPQTSSNLQLPDNVEGITEELSKQESLLEQIHSEMNHGLVNKTREEQLWEVQRIITQLKRKLRTLERNCGGCSSQQSMDETDCSLKYEVDEPNLKIQPQEQLASKSIIVDSSMAKDTNSSVSKNNSGSSNVLKPEGTTSEDSKKPQENIVDEKEAIEKIASVESQSPPLPPLQHHSTFNSLPPYPNHYKSMTSESMEVEDINGPILQLAEKKQLAILETEELTNVIINLRALCELEMKEINRIKNKIFHLGGNPEICNFKQQNNDMDGNNLSVDDTVLLKRKEMDQETKKLQIEKDSLVKSICAECDACIDLRIRIKLIKMNKSH